jgi:hypothetical protein
MKKKTALIFLILMAACCAVPVTGVDQYLGGSPQMTAYISGVNEFSPGQDATVTVVIQNSGTNTVKFVGHSMLAQNDLPTTAKLVTAGLSAGSAPIIIKTDPQELGDIASPGVVTATFAAKITSDATLGDYQLPLTLSYTYLANSNTPQPSIDTVQSQYDSLTTVIPLTIRIKPEVKIDVLGAIPGNLIVGTEGYVNLTIENTGPEAGTRASVMLIRNGDSVLIPADSSVYIGDFPQDRAVSCLYKVSVSDDAQPQSYPIDVMVTYTNSEGFTVDSATDTVGVPVGGKLGFAVTSAPASLSPGESKVIEVEYRNTGSITAYHAQARLTIVEPFSSSDTQAYLGDVAPGQSVTARYAISADSRAAPALYELDTNVRYRDSLDNSLTSDTVSAPVEVVPPKSGSLLLPTAAVLAAVVLTGAGYYVFAMRRKR